MRPALFSGGLMVRDTLLRNAPHHEDWNLGTRRSELWLSLRDELLHVLDRFEKFGLEFLDHRAGGFDGIDHADTLADKIADQFAGALVAGGGRLVDCYEGLGRDQRLQRHRQRAGAVRAAVPRVGPHRAQLPRRLSGAAARAYRVTGSRRDHLLAENFRG